MGDDAAGTYRRLIAALREGDRSGLFATETVIARRMSRPDDMEPRVDPLTGAQVQIVGSRQARPNLPGAGCPFCVGGIEAPEPYDTKAFANRWPSFPTTGARSSCTPPSRARFWPPRRRPTPAR